METIKPTRSDEEVELRRGPWTAEEDHILVNYIEQHGEGRWNSLARCSGLKRTGKSCRLRWLNYLHPNVRRGNITPEEQLLILELHSRYGNRWSRIAQHLPGRTDNEIKNYWRTRVQKHATQLNCDVSSKKFQDVMRYLWMPRLVERIRAAASGSYQTPRADVSALPICPASSSSDSVVTRFSSPPASVGEINSGGLHMQVAGFDDGVQDTGGDSNQGVLDFEQYDMGGDLWNVEDIWF